MHSDISPLGFSSSSTSSIERITVSTGLAYKALIVAFEGQLGRWQQEIGDQLVRESAPWPAVQAAIEKMQGPHGLMLFFHVDQGELASLGGHAMRARLYLVGNPVTATGILKADVRAAMLVPFRVEVYEDGAAGFLSYDRPSSSLGSLGAAGLNDVGRELDGKMAAVAKAVQQSAKQSRD
jgi:uncharacterized protein (DUF302 family)